MSTSSSRDLVDKLAEEFAERYRRGERPALSEYTQKYPDLAGQIRDLFPALVMMEEFGSVAGEPTGPFEQPEAGTVPVQLGEYRLLREVGRGGMGIVYEAEQESLGRHVALKVLLAPALSKALHLERFRREARAAARLHHTNIVPVFGFGEELGIHYYAMQFIQGQGLDLVLKELKRLRVPKTPPRPPAGPKDLTISIAHGLLTGQFTLEEPDNGVAIRAGPPLAPGGGEAAPAAGTTGAAELTTVSPAQASSAFAAQSDLQYFRSVARLGLQVADALEYAHRQGVLHRDIKPSNLLLDTRGTAWVTDFGLAKADDSGDLTNPGDVVGTLRYMAPERFRRQADARSDVYSLGVTLYEMLTLRAIFTDTDKAQLMRRIQEEHPPQPRKLNARLPRDLETIVLKATAKEPADRYATAANLAEDLERYLSDRPIKARRTSLAEQAWRWCRRNPALASLIASVAVLLIVVTLVSTVSALWLKEAHTKTLAHLTRAKDSERDAKERLVQSLLNQAKAGRSTIEPGRRFAGLEALTEAARVARQLHMPEDRFLQLRNEAIACLPLVDLRKSKVWQLPPDVRPLAVDAQMKRYARGDDQGNISVRWIADDKEIVPLPGAGVRAHIVLFSPDGQYLAANYHHFSPAYIMVWDLSRGEAIFKSAPGVGQNDLDFSPDSRQIAAVREDGAISVYELASGKEVKRLAAGPPAQRIRFHPDGGRLAVGSLQAPHVQIRGFDSECVITLPHDKAVRGLGWRRDGKLLATGCDDGNIYVWQVSAPGKPLRVLKGHQAQVVRVAFNQRGDLLASAGWDVTTRLWDAMTGTQLVSAPYEPYGYRLEFCADDRLMDCRGEGTRAWLWEVASGRECRTFRGHKGLRSVSISPDGRLMASGGDDGIRLWDLQAASEADKQLAQVPAPSCRSVIFHPDGKSLITTVSAGVHRWPIKMDLASATVHIGPPQAILPRRDPGAAVLSPDGHTLAVFPEWARALILDLREPGRKFMLESPSLAGISFSPDGAWIATGTWQATAVKGAAVKIWDAQTRKPIRDLPTGPATTVAFSPDGRWLVTSTGAEYRFWKVGSWEPSLAISRAGAGSVGDNIVFTRDGKMLAIAYSRTIVKLVDPETGREFATLPTTGQPICFSPDGSALVTVGENGTIQLWDLRLIRRQLAAMNLDWDLPPYPPAEVAEAKPLRVQVDLGELAKAPTNPAASLQKLHAQRDLYTLLTGLSPLHPEPYRLRGHVSAKLRLYEPALHDFSAALARQPAHDLARVAHLYEARARNYWRLKQHAKAARDFEKSLALQPDQARVCNSLAWLYVTGPAELRAADKALPLAQRAVRLQPTDWNCLNTLGAVHYRLGRFTEAIATLERAIKHNKNEATAFDLFVLALCHHHLDDTPKAKDCYERAVQWQEAHQHRLSSGNVESLDALRAEAQAALAGLLK